MFHNRHNNYNNGPSGRSYKQRNNNTIRIDRNWTSSPNNNNRFYGENHHGTYTSCRDNSFHTHHQDTDHTQHQHQHQHQHQWRTRDMNNNSDERDYFNHHNNNNNGDAEHNYSRNHNDRSREKRGHVVDEYVYVLQDCFECQKSLHRKEFSKTQWKKGNSGSPCRCIDCIKHNQPKENQKRSQSESQPSRVKRRKLSNDNSDDHDDDDDDDDDNGNDVDVDVDDDDVDDDDDDDDDESDDDDDDDDGDGDDGVSVLNDWFSTFETNYGDNNFIGNGDENEENLLSEVVDSDYGFDWDTLELAILRRPNQVKYFSVGHLCHEHILYNEPELSLLEWVLTHNKPPLHIIKVILRADPDSILCRAQDTDTDGIDCGFARPLRIAACCGHEIDDHVLKYLLHASIVALPHYIDPQYKNNPLNVINFLLVDEPDTFVYFNRDVSDTAVSLKSLGVILVEMSDIIVIDDDNDDGNDDDNDDDNDFDDSNNSTNNCTNNSMDENTYNDDDDDNAGSSEYLEDDNNKHRPYNSTMEFYLLFITKKDFNSGDKNQQAYIDHVKILQTLVKVDKHFHAFLLDTDNLFIHKILSRWWPACWENCYGVEGLVKAWCLIGNNQENHDELLPLRKWYNGSLPLHLAVKNKWPLGMIQELLELDPHALQLRDTNTGLYPFQLAVVSTTREVFNMDNFVQSHAESELAEKFEKRTLLRGVTNCFHLLRRSPQHVVSRSTDPVLSS